jgi:hypothetical protein
MNWSLLQLSFAPIHDTGGHGTPIVLGAVPRGAHNLALIDRPVWENQMANPMRMWRTWRSSALQAVWLASEAHRVVGLPCMQIVTESLQGRQSECRRMVAEKIAALAEAHAAAATAAIKAAVAITLQRES